MIVAKETEVEIAKAREIYRPIAERGSLIFFLIDQLNVIDHMYQFSLDAFNYIFQKALDKAKPADELDARAARPAGLGHVHHLRVRDARPLRAPPPHLLVAARDPHPVRRGELSPTSSTS